MNQREQFIKEFTKHFLIDFFGTDEYFDIDAIAKQAEPLIIDRINKLKEFVDNKPALVESVLCYKCDNFDDQPNTSEFNRNDYFDLTYCTLQYLFVTDLFVVTSTPIAYAYEFSKDYCPNGDLFSGKKVEINTKFNLFLLQWAQQEDFDFEW